MLSQYLTHFAQIRKVVSNDSLLTKFFLKCVFLRDLLRPESIIITNQLSKVIWFSQHPECRDKKQMV